MMLDSFFRSHKRYTPPKNNAYIRPVSTLDVVDAFVVYANPQHDTEKEITLIKPPIIFSKNSYSTPVTMPIGLAYLAAVLDKGQYRVRILDCPGLAMDNIRLTPDGKFKVQGI